MTLYGIQVESEWSKTSKYEILLKHHSSAGGWAGPDKDHMFHISQFIPDMARKKKILAIFKTLH